MRRSALLMAFAVSIMSLLGFVSSPAYAAASPITSSVAKPFEGQKFTLTGNIGTAFKRPVKLQQYTSSWKDVGSDTKTLGDGSYSFTTSTTASSRRYRVVAAKTPSNAAVTSPEITIKTRVDEVNLVLSRNRASGIAYGYPEIKTDGRSWRLQVEKSGDWVTVATVAEKDGVVTAPFAIGKNNYRLVGAAISGSSGAYSNHETSAKGPSELGPHVMFITTESGSLPSTKGKDYVGTAGIDNSAPLALETVAVRGHSSVKYPKKSFKVKYEDSQTPLGLPKGKTFNLLPNYQDHSLLRTAVGIGMVSQSMDKMPWTPHRAFTELFINGKYRGSYELIESIKIQPQTKKNDPRVNIDPEKGVIVEINPSDQETVPGIFKASKSKMYFGLKDPDEVTKLDDGTYDPEGVTPDKKRLMKEKVQAFEAALYGKDYRNKDTGWQHYMTMDSAVDWYITKEFLKDWDGDFQASTFFYDPNVFDKNAKFVMDPVWDVDRSAGSKTSSPPYASSPKGLWMNGDPGKVLVAGKVARDYHTTHWFTRITDDPAFKAAVKVRWAAKKGVFRDAGKVDVDAALKQLSYTAAYNDRDMWQDSQPDGRYLPRSGSYKGEIKFLKNWYNDRYSYLNGQFD